VAQYKKYSIIVCSCCEPDEIINIPRIFSSPVYVGSQTVSASDSCRVP